MKAIPILIITNALALGLVIVLFLQQEDLQTQLSSNRSGGVRDVPADTGQNDRIAKLERV